MGEKEIEFEQTLEIRSLPHIFSATVGDGKDVIQKYIDHFKGIPNSDKISPMFFSENTLQTGITTVWREDVTEEKL